jgi:hypothetical protein
MPFLIVVREYGYPPTTYWKSAKNDRRSTSPAGGWPFLMTAWMAIALCRLRKNGRRSPAGTANTSTRCRSRVRFAYLRNSSLAATRA